jgi:hypothetical protein
VETHSTHVPSTLTSTVHAHAHVTCLYGRLDLALVLCMIDTSLNMYSVRATSGDATRYKLLLKFAPSTTRRDAF